MEHKYRMATHSYLPLYSALKKYTWDAVTWEIVSEHETLEEAEEMEIKLIAEGKQNSYNIADGGKCIRINDEIRKKLSEGLLGRVVKEETKNKLREIAKKQFSTEVSKLRHAKITKMAMAKPEIREKYLRGLKTRRNAWDKRKAVEDALRLEKFKLLAGIYKKNMSLKFLAQQSGYSYTFVRRWKKDWFKLVPQKEGK